MGVDTAEGTGVEVLFVVGTGTGVSRPDGTGTGVLTLVGTGVGVRAPRALVLGGTGAGVLALVGTGAGVQSGWVGDGDGDGWRVAVVGEGPAGAGVLAAVGTGTGVSAPDGTGTGVAQPGAPAAWYVLAACLTPECADAESSRAGWLGLADATASPTPPASRAMAGSPSQAIVRVPGVLMLTSSSGGGDHGRCRRGCGRRRPPGSGAARHPARPRDRAGHPAG